MLNRKTEPLDHPFLNVVSGLNNEYISSARSGGKKAIGFFCSYVPRELLDAAGLVPYRMRAPNNTGTDVADTYLGQFNCSYTRCVLESILDDSLDFIDGYVFVASCDHLRRLYDNVRYLVKPDLCHILDLPHKTHDDAVDWYTEELHILRDNIEQSLGNKIRDDDIVGSIKRTNELRTVLSKIQELRKIDEPKLTGEEMHRIMVGINSTPADVAIEQLKEIYEKLEERDPPRGYRARLLIMGSQMDDPAYIAAMEEMGGLVVGDAFCEGSIQFAEMVDEDEEPLRALATRYVRKLSCPRMFEGFKERYGRIADAVSEYRADGVVIEPMKFCDTWNIDAQLFVNRFRDDHIEVLKLEREYMLSGVGQLRTRVQAFIEMMGK